MLRKVTSGFKFQRSESIRMLSGRIALVTGGAAGIGRAVAKAIQREGARVAVADTDIDGALQTIEVQSKLAKEIYFSMPMLSNIKVNLVYNFNF